MNQNLIETRKQLFKEIDEQELERQLTLELVETSFNITKGKKDIIGLNVMKGEVNYSDNTEGRYINVSIHFRPVSKGSYPIADLVRKILRTTGIKFEAQNLGVGKVKTHKERYVILTLQARFD